MSKLKNIMTGFGSLFKGDSLTPEQQKRLEICAACPLKKFSQSVDIIDKNFETKKVSGYFCSVCDCYLAAKIRVNDEECPKKKWGKITN